MKLVLGVQERRAELTPALLGKMGPAMRARKPLGSMLGAQAEVINSFCHAGLCRAQEKAH